MNKIIILNKGVLYEPVLVGEVQWSTERQSTAGKLAFEVVKDEFIDFQEGNEVTFYFNEQPVFFGYVFEKTRDKSGTIKVTAYDQLRYFKNKDTYIGENIKASELLKIFISLFSLKEGHISDTGYVLPLFNEEGATLFDMIQVALDETLTHTQNIFTLYDDFGAICLKNVEEMRLNIMVNSETLENFDYSSSIDSDTYNQVKVVYKDKKTGRQAEAVSRSSENINKWGVLQYYETTQEEQGIREKSQGLLSLYNRKTRSLSLKNVLGDIGVRGGSCIFVDLDLGDIGVFQYFLCERVTHTFKENMHLMDITLKGSDFVE